MRDSRSKAMTSHSVYIALGSNLGDRQANIAQALEQLRAHPQIKVLAVADLIATTAIGGPADSPEYLNGAAHLETTLAPHALLEILLGIEAQLGRIRRQHWEPRLIDLDILFYDQQIIAAADLKVPHPLLHRRRFVLQPLEQLAPDLVHPILGQTITQLLRKLPSIG